MTRGSLIGTAALAVSLASVSAARADVVTDWNVAALNAIRAEKTPPPRASRALAILHAAMYDAVNGISRSHEPYFVQSRVPSSASKEAAASAAAHRVLIELFPGAIGAFDSLHAATLAAIPEHPQKRAGTMWGESVAAQMLGWRASDGSDSTMAPPTGTGPGAWVATPPAFAPYALPQWGFVAPFGMPTGSFLRPVGPPSLTSERYAGDLNEVKALGAAAGSSRTPEQDLIAIFWADGAGTETPPGHWNTIARVAARSAGLGLDENARLFALLNVALADAAICAWDAKYAYNFWRPVTAIHGADADGNPATTGDPTWSSFIVTPPFPDYVSGHSTFSGAAATVLAMFFGTDAFPFAVGSDFLPGVIREFEGFSAAAAEAAVSRLYGGIHFRSANEDGLTAGIGIGEWVFTHSMLPKDRARK